MGALADSSVAVREAAAAGLRENADRFVPSTTWWFQRQRHGRLTKPFFHLQECRDCARLLHGKSSHRQKGKCFQCYMI